MRTIRNGNETFEPEFNYSLERIVEKHSRSRFKKESITVSHRELNSLPDESISF